jgi:hypothetical protein
MTPSDKAHTLLDLFLFVVIVITLILVISFSGPAT